MLREKLRRWFQEEKRKLSSLSLRGKLDYIWMYYKWWIVCFGILVVAAVWGVQDYQHAHKEVLISGIFLNTATSREGYAFVSDDYWAQRGADPDTRVDLIEARAIDFNAEQPLQDEVNGIMSVDTQIASQALDYIIGDLTTIEYYAGRELCADLNTLFSPEQLAQWEIEETEEGVPVAINLTGSRLERDYTLYAQPSYLMFVVNTPRPEKCAAFSQYLWS